MVLQKVGETQTEVQVNGTTEYGPAEQSDDSTYDVGISTSTNRSHISLTDYYESGETSYGFDHFYHDVFKIPESLGTLDISWTLENVADMNYIELYAVDVDGNETLLDEYTNASGSTSGSTSMSDAVYIHIDAYAKDYGSYIYDVTTEFLPPSSSVSSDYTVDGVNKS